PGRSRPGAWPRRRGRPGRWRSGHRRHASKLRGVLGTGKVAAPGYHPNGLHGFFRRRRKHGGGAVDACTSCLRSITPPPPGERPWCSWCGDYADRYATRMPLGIDVRCTVAPVRDTTRGLHLSLNADILGTWTWGALWIEVLNRSPTPMTLSYPASPLACLE